MCAKSISKGLKENFDNRWHDSPRLFATHARRYLHRNQTILLLVFSPYRGVYPALHATAVFLTSFLSIKRILKALFNHCTILPGCCSRQLVGRYYPCISDESFHKNNIMVRSK